MEEATAEILDHEVYPIGELTAEDIESLSGLMAAWARRGSVHAALSVEKLLKRIVDDMHAGNDVAKVTTRMYTYVSMVLHELTPVGHIAIETNAQGPS